MRHAPILAAFALTLAAGRGHAEPPAVPCPEIAMPPLAVPHMREAIAKHEQVVVVAIGSSSTQSWMSTDPAHSYPAVLQERLTEALPMAHVAVLNRGIGGQDALEEVARLDDDVVAVKPVLVIWQVGANGALRHSDPSVYKKLVTAGVARLRKIGADVVLMDNQRSPRVLESPEHAIIDQATADVAAASGAGLFSRGLLMDAWNRAGHPYSLFISPDSLHQNDYGYRCVARALAASIEAGLGPDKPGG